MMMKRALTLTAALLLAACGQEAAAPPPAADASAIEAPAVEAADKQAAAPSLPAHAQARPLAVDPSFWVGAWATSQQIPEPRNALDPADLTDATLRQTVRVTRGGDMLRVRVTNAFGTEPLTFDAVHLARSLGAGTAAIEPESDVALTFAGKSKVVVPAGADFLSDPINYPIDAFEDLALTLYFEEPLSQQTSHPGSRTTSYLAEGNLAAAADLPDATPVEHWYQIAGIDVIGEPNAAAIAVLGDSITDGRGSTTNQNNRWTDYLAKRLQENPETQHLSVLNHGIGGNRLFNYGLGPSALARFDRDVAAQTGVKYLIVLEGVNDLGTATRETELTPEEHEALVDRVIAAYDQIITRAHARGIKVYGATILPFAGSGYYPMPPEVEADWRAINDWIRNSGRFDAVIDLAKALEDPERPTYLLAEYDIGDGLHPSPAGFERMAAEVPLELFAE